MKNHDFEKSVIPCQIREAVGVANNAQLLPPYKFGRGLPRGCFLRFEMRKSGDDVIIFYYGNVIENGCICID